MFVDDQRSAHVGEAVFLERYGEPVATCKHLMDDMLDCERFVSTFPLLDEPCVFREAAGIKEEGCAVCMCKFICTAQILQRNRLSATGVIGDGHQYKRHQTFVLLERLLECLEIDVAGEIGVARVRQIESHHAVRFGVRTRRIEETVRRHYESAAIQMRIQSMFSRAALMEEIDTALFGRCAECFVECLQQLEVSPVTAVCRVAFEQGAQM